jgi:hypothetical protein
MKERQEYPLCDFVPFVVLFFQHEDEICPNKKQPAFTWSATEQPN